MEEINKSELESAISKLSEIADKIENNSFEEFSNKFDFSFVDFIKSSDFTLSNAHLEKILEKVRTEGSNNNGNSFKIAEKNIFDLNTKNQKTLFNLSFLHLSVTFRYTVFNTLDNEAEWGDNYRDWLKLLVQIFNIEDLDDYHRFIYLENSHDFDSELLSFEILKLLPSEVKNLYIDFIDAWFNEIKLDDDIQDTADFLVNYLREKLN